MMSYKVLGECLRVKIGPHKVAGTFMITTHRVSVKGGVWVEARVYLFDSLLLKRMLSQGYDNPYPNPYPKLNPKKASFKNPTPVPNPTPRFTDIPAHHLLHITLRYQIKGDGDFLRVA